MPKAPYRARNLSTRPRRPLRWASSTLARSRCAMKEIVAGTETTPKGFEASEWLTQVNKSREARTSKGTTIPPLPAPRTDDLRPVRPQMPRMMIPQRPIVRSHHANLGGV
ncbi:hypothetical protein HPB50_006297 [Hyalomma asiaticum]|uniref:Uncharacterized protein n=1 Tax=Hyalomma asiaticum TaxID=266040 RepID=A0ACB7SCP3_HYAAI|nr:hypothetical protein HPB50_006297 [Hyalomma asiaticum]